MAEKIETAKPLIIGLVLLSFFIATLLWVVQGIMDGAGKAFMSVFGSSVYVISKRDVPLFHRWLFFTVGMITGIKGAAFISTVVDAKLHSSGIEAHLPNDLSALVLSALIVFVLTSLYHLDIKEIFNEILKRWFP